MPPFRILVEIQVRCHLLNLLDDVSSKILQYFPSQNQWKILGDLPQPRFGHTVTIVGNQIILIGGAFQFQGATDVEINIIDNVLVGDTATFNFTAQNLQSSAAKFILFGHTTHLLQTNSSQFLVVLN
jgi:hypothetical protein